MKNILCFGDSNTWGYIPVIGKRFAKDIRWTGKLQNILGTDYNVIEEGLNGRTTALDDPLTAYRNGEHMLPCLLDSHRPLDLIIIMLGTNDLKAIFAQTAEQIASNAKRLCQIVQNHQQLQEHKPRILLVSPTHVTIDPEQPTSFQLQANQQSKLFNLYYQQVANELAVDYIDASEVINITNDDGVHWLASQHLDFASFVANTITNLKI